MHAIASCRFDATARRGYRTEFAGLRRVWPIAGRRLLGGSATPCCGARQAAAQIVRCGALVVTGARRVLRAMHDLADA
jgi:hypothetical protein